mgnify:CR=1 FL=1
MQPHNPNNKRVKLCRKLMTWIILGFFSLQPILAAAQPNADSNAPGQQRPLVETTASGIPLVQITTPSAAGVSRNLFNLLSVGPEGLVLNNATKITQTQLAGYVAPNPYLVNGSARVIINEVTSVNPSYLRGYIEVAGQRADVIIANPNGIYGDGFGFLNTSRAVLTTGTPVFGGSGSLDAFRVTGGLISITGTGMDASTVDQTELLSRSAAINAGIWAKDLTVVTGANEINYSNLNSTKIQGLGDKPQVAIDVGLLGGMYAQKIRLIGTENGVGVNSKGTIAATGSDLVITTEGKVQLAGSTSAAGNININAREAVTNQNLLYAKGNTSITSQETIQNTGTLVSGNDTSLVAQGITSTGVLGAGINSDGTLGTTGNLSINTSKTTKIAGQNITAGNLDINASAIDMAGSTNYVGNNASLDASAGDINHTGATTDIGGSLTATATGAIKNDKDAGGKSAQITAGQLSLSASNISNRGGKLSQFGQATTNITATNKIDNAGGIIATNGDKLNIDAKLIENISGGTIVGNRQVNLTAQSLNNSQGAIGAGGTLDIDSTAVNNSGGSLGANQDVNLTTQSLTGSGSKIIAGRNLTADITGDFTNQTDSELHANGVLKLSVTGALSNEGTLTAVDTLNVTGTNITNQTGGTMAAGKLNLNTAGDIANHGWVDGSLINTTSKNFNNRAVVTADVLNVKADTITNEGAAAVIYTNNQANLYAQTSLENKDDATIYSLGNIVIAGGSADKNGQYTKRTGTVLNQSANIEAEQDIGIYVDQLTNKKREFAVEQVQISQTQHSDPISPLPPRYASGKYSKTYLSGNANYEQTVTETQATIDSPEGRSIAGRNIGIQATKSVTNDLSHILAGGKLTAIVGDGTGTVNNTAVARSRVTTNDGTANYFVEHRISHHVRHDEIWHKNEQLDYYNQTSQALPAYKALFGGGQTVQIIAKNVNNITLNPNGAPIGDIATTLPSGGIPSGSDNPKTTFTVPQGGMFIINNNPDAKYLVQTDPRFTNYRNFMSSDYMLQRFSSDPQRIRKRLGDGFYEQQLVRDQITNLTGRRFLEGYSSNEAQYQALMDSGITFAQQYNLHVGISLTADQMAQLTSDIVWMEERTVGGQRALVPVVYLANAGNITLKASGAVISADNVLINASGNLTNSGQINSENMTIIDADTIINRGGKIDSKGLTQVVALQDIINQSGTIAGGQVNLFAGRDVVNETVVSAVDRGNLTTTMVNQQASIQARQGALNIQADRDIINNGAQLQAVQDINLQAGRNIQVGVVEHNETNSAANGGFKYNSAKTTNIVSSIDAVGNVNVVAKNDANLRGAQVNAGEDIKLIAGGNVNITEVKDRAFEEKENKGSKYYLHTKKDDETVIGSNLTAQGDITVAAVKLPGATETKGGNVLVEGSNITSNTGGVLLAADKDVTIREAVQHSEKNSASKGVKYKSAKTTNIVSSIDAVGNVNVVAKNDANLRGAQVNAGEDIKLTAGGNVNITAVKDRAFEEKERKGRKYYLHTKTDDETVVGSNLTAEGNITVAAVQVSGTTEIKGGTVLVEGSNITSNTGGVLLVADKDVTIQEVGERHETASESWHKKSGFLSSTTTTKRDHTIDNVAVGSTVSGETVTVQSGKDLTVQGSNVAATSDVNLSAENNVNITTAQETHEGEHYYYKKKSGLSVSFGGGGVGVFVGSTKQQTNATEQGANQVGSTVGSVEGQVNISAEKDVKITGSDIIGTQGINVTGQNMTVDAAKNTAEIKETYEYKQSGLTVSVGNTMINAVGAADDNIKRSGQVEDNRLKALYVYKAGREIVDANKNIDKAKADKKDTTKLSVSVGIGSTSQKSETTTQITTAQGSTLTSDGKIKLIATGSGAKDADGKVTDGDLNVIGSTVEGQDVLLSAARDINLQSAVNTSDTTGTSSGKSSSIGATLSPSAGGWGGFANTNKSSGNEAGHTTTHNETMITARDTLAIDSGRDTNLIGAQASGNKVVVDVGRNLNIESQQDIDTYHSDNKSTGFGIKGIGSGDMSATGSYSKGKINSDYRSVNEQTGIFAGTEGFDIEVRGNTDLKGAVIASKATPDKNKLSTDTLTFSDIQNKAEYEASSIGVNVGIGKGTKDKDKGITPNIGVPASGDADSTTKSAVSPGTIEVRSDANKPEGQKTNLSKLSRDTTNAVNSLGKIFDKKTVQERQELAKVFGEEAYKLVGDLALDQYKKATKNRDKATTAEEKAFYQRQMDQWDEGGANKIALHALVGGIMSDLGGNSFVSGAVGAGVNEAIQGQLSKIKDPSLHQWTSAIIGAAASAAVGGNAQTGAATAASGTKNNWLNHDQQVAFARALANAKTDAEKAEIVAYYYAVSRYNIEKYGEQKEIVEEDTGLFEQLNNLNIGTDAGGAGKYTFTDGGLNYNLSALANKYDVSNKAESYLGQFKYQDYMQVYLSKPGTIVFDFAKGYSEVQVVDGEARRFDTAPPSKGTVVWVNGDWQVVNKDGQLETPKWTTYQLGGKTFTATYYTGSGEFPAPHPDDADAYYAVTDQASKLGQVLVDIAGATAVGRSLGDALSKGPSKPKFVNKVGKEYPEIVDPRTGKNINYPEGDLQKVPKDQRVEWNNQTRADYIKEWHDRGYKIPEGGWEKYDIHHIKPREYGGDNSFKNLVPVERNLHQGEFNKFWIEF